MTKKYLDVTETMTISPYELEGRIVDVIAMLQKYVDKHGEDAFMSYESDLYSDSMEYEISWTRKETEKERQKRLAKERREAEKKKREKEKEKERMRKEYERLKKIFEGESK